MTSGQLAAVHRIDAERKAAHNVIYRRLTNARRTGEFADAIRRQALLAYLNGMRRMTLDASRSLRFDVRAAHHDLSMADDRRDDAEIRQRIAWLGLSVADVERAKARAARIAGRAGDELRRIARRPDNLSGANLAIEPSGGNVARFIPGTTDVFGTFGRANVSDAIVDTWAETVAYSQYEAGRKDAVTQYPAISEMLWGFKWDSTIDSHTTTGCLLLNRWTAPLGDTRMKALAPPRLWNCRSVLVPVWQSSALRTPVATNEPSDALFARLLAEKEAYLRKVA